jgi:hypothetical protein
MEDFRRTSACGVFNDPKLFPIPSHDAMRIVSDIRRIDTYGDSSVIACLTYSEAAQLIEYYAAAQRQAGREEERQAMRQRYEEWSEGREKWAYEHGRQAGSEEERAIVEELRHDDIAFIEERYAAVVEAAKLAKETLEYVKKYIEGQGLSAEDDCAEAVEAINKALRDLDEAKGGE